MADEPTTELTKSEEIAGAIAVTDRGICITNIDDLFRFANMVVKSGLAPQAFKTVEQVMVATQMGLELGLRPMSAIRTIMVINGRPAIWGDGMLGVVYASNKMEWIDEKIEGEGEGMVATCIAKRKGDPKECVRRYTVDDAKQAKLWMNQKKSTWCEHPKRMLQMRARAFCLRDKFADVLAGCLSTEEALDIDAERATFDPNQAQGDKAENLAKALKPGSEVVAEQRSDPTTTTNDGKIESSQEDTSAAPDPEQAKSSSSIKPTENPTPTTDESTPSAGPESSPKDTGGEQAGVETMIHNARYADLCHLIEVKAEVSVPTSAKLAVHWLRKRKKAIDDLADDGLWQIIFKAAQRQDWEKFKADNPKLLGD